MDLNNPGGDLASPVQAPEASQATAALPPTVMMSCMHSNQYFADKSTPCFPRACW